MNVDSLVWLAHAYRLTALDLLHPDSTPRDGPPREQLADLLIRDNPHVEPILADDVVAESFARAPPGQELAALHALATALVNIQDGRPVLISASHAPQLAAALDPDVLAVARASRAWGLHGRHGEQALVSWPVLLRQARGPFESLFGRPMADTHVHLAGAMPTGLRWLVALTSRTPLEMGRLSEDSRQRWKQQLDLARGVLVALIEDSGRTERACEADEFVEALRRFWPRAYGQPHEDLPTIAESVSLGYLVPERILLLRALADPAASGSLVRYVRVKNAFHRAVVLRPGGRGLARFRAMRRRGTVTVVRQQRIQAARIQMSAVVESYLSNLGGRASPTRAARSALSLELRVGLPGRGEVMRDLVRGWALGASETLERWAYPEMRLGLVFHSSRSARADESRAEAEARYLHAHESLWSWLVEVPAARRLVVGIDAAGDELAGPPRSFRVAFTRLRERLDRQWPDAHAQIRLGFTFHAGEDFRDLLSGIRCVHESSELLGLRPGDRLGHGLALFWPAKDFYTMRPRAQPKLGDHVLDLLWATSMLDAVGSDLARHARERLIGELVRSGVDNPTATVTKLSLLLRHDQKWQDASNEDLLAELGVTEAASGRLHPVSIDPQWLELVEAARDAAARDVLRKGLVVEVNPTSNLLIGGFRSYTDLPYLRAYADQPERFAERIPITINTDDPGVFQTTLTNEYNQVGRALIELGLTHGQAWDWLDRVRQVANRSCFIPNDAPVGRELHELLLKLCEH